MDQTQKVEVVSVVVTLLLFVFKFLTYKFSGSIAIFADAIHSFSDSFTSILVLIGITFSKRKTKTFPFGLYKLENLISLFVAFAILYTGYEIVKESVFKGNHAVENRLTAALVAAISALVSFLLAQYKLGVGRKYNSPSLIADGHHSKSDALSSIVVFAGIMANVDKYAAIVVAFFIFRSAFEPLIDSLKVLLDASVEPDILMHVKEILSSDPRVKKIKRLIGRNSGRYRFIEAVIEISVRDLKSAHRISEELESRIKEEIPNVDEVLIHYEPAESDEYIIAIPLKDDESISDQLGTANYFVLVRVHQNEVIEKRIVKNPYKNLEKGRGRSIGEFLSHEGVSYIILKNEPTGGSKYILEGLGITILSINSDSPKEALRSAIELISR